MPATTYAPARGCATDTPRHRGSDEARRARNGAQADCWVDRAAGLIARCFARNGPLSAPGPPATRRPSRATSATPGRFGSLAVAMRALRLDHSDTLLLADRAHTTQGLVPPSRAAARARPARSRTRLTSGVQAM